MAPHLLPGSAPKLQPSLRFFLYMPTLPVIELIHLALSLMIVSRWLLVNSLATQVGETNISGSSHGMDCSSSVLSFCKGLVVSFQISSCKKHVNIWNWFKVAYSTSSSPKKLLALDDSHVYWCCCTVWQHTSFTSTQSNYPPVLYTGNWWWIFIYFMSPF